MDAASFKKSLREKVPPQDLSPALKALWFDAHGDWEQAHKLAQDVTDTAGAWVHAYLHRKEGDESNAAYWYRRAGQTPFSGPLEREWDQIAATLFAHQREGQY
jgi:arginase family enzyme